MFFAPSKIIFKIKKNLVPLEVRQNRVKLTFLTSWKLCEFEKPEIFYNLKNRFSAFFHKFFFSSTILQKRKKLKILYKIQQEGQKRCHHNFFLKAFLLQPLLMPSNSSTSCRKLCQIFHLLRWKKLQFELALTRSRFSFFLPFSRKTILQTQPNCLWKSFYFSIFSALSKTF